MRRSLFFFPFRVRCLLGAQAPMFASGSVEANMAGKGGNAIKQTDIKWKLGMEKK